MSQNRSTLHGPAAKTPGTCNACGHPILWVKDTTRRWVALDPTPSPTGSHAYLGDTRAVRLADFTDPPITTTTVPRHSPHALTCGASR